MKYTLLFTLVLVAHQPLILIGEEWTVAYRAGRDPGLHEHFKIEIEDSDVTLTDLSDRNEVSLELSAGDLKVLKGLIEKYIYAAQLEVSKDKIRDFVEVQFEYSEENKSIEVEFTFPKSGMPDDIENLFTRYQRRLVSGK